MAELTCQFVRPDRQLFRGPAASLVLVTYAGELGVWPGHAAEIVALGDGVVRITRTAADGGGEYDVVVSGGYAEIENDEVIILADHARLVDDIDEDDRRIVIECFHTVRKNSTLLPEDKVVLKQALKRVERHSCSCTVL